MKVVNCRREPYTHYIGRPSPLGNPYSHREGTQALEVVTTREIAVAKFEWYVRGRPDLLQKIKELPEDAVLGCWCKPKYCHGDIIVKLWKELHGRPA